MATARSVGLLAHSLEQLGVLPGLASACSGQRGFVDELREGLTIVQRAFDLFAYRGHDRSRWESGGVHGPVVAQLRCDL